MVFACHLTASPALAHSGLDGAWSITAASGTNAEGDWSAENLQPSLYLFHGNHYSITRVNGEAPRPLMPEDASRDSLTPEQAASMWKPFTSNAGTYSTEGSTMTMKPMVALWPNFMESGTASYTFSVDGDTLTLGNSGENSSYTITLTRLK
jgi:hypothetical protein